MTARILPWSHAAVVNTSTMKALLGLAPTLVLSKPGTIPFCLIDCRCGGGIWRARQRRCDKQHKHQLFYLHVYFYHHDRHDCKGSHFVGDGNQNDDGDDYIDLPVFHDDHQLYFHGGRYSFKHEKRAMRELVGISFGCHP
ncbi:hypothetical protein BC830DRAFT_697921 [Chytriomyces sp. MP71]|nr:hypothetical protein BC830DRAFT_697921 [Chytriomyces sp. MP71]